ncbi:hypothetical protein MOQ72_35560 [Saccharopolyspora sp. K220]|uniref:hypothetical protein n=1 Tax=Saccharopolyspora soli TaxID=2926618 RepID=UPI001F55EDC9|nr:hypothetical protein [Saccharopolyspora soli]MCI2422757.1 hypothetical protein [Saccharopolyspora soli]
MTGRENPSETRRSGAPHQENAASKDLEITTLTTQTATSIANRADVAQAPCGTDAAEEART